MNDDIFSRALPILHKLHKQQYEAYFVGGCVRDLLLDRTITDIDITTSAKPDEIITIFPKVIPVGIDHGTVIVRHQGESFEVTTYRIDEEDSDSRCPNSDGYSKQLLIDLQRRDFTINALAMDVNREIVDLFDAKADMEAKQIKTVGNSEQRFKEDALRIIRALRFSSQLDFEIHPDTLKQMLVCKKDISHLAVERITNEMAKFYAGQAVNKGLAYLRQTKIYEQLPVFKEHPDLILKLPKQMQPLPSFAAVIVLFHYYDQSIPITEWVRKWKCSNETKRIASHLFNQVIYYQNHSLNKTLAYHLDERVYELFTILIEIIFNKTVSSTEIKQLKNQLVIQTRDDLVINGRDLRQLFPDRKVGPWLKETLQQVEALVINEKLPNQMNDIKEWLRCNQQEIN